jgi:hypothetical protein
MLLTERYHDQIRGVLHCFDRVIITGTLADFGHPVAATRYLNKIHCRIFDFPEFAKPLRDRIRSNAEALAERDGVTIEFLRSSKTRKEDRIQQVLAERGTHPGLVHILTAMEACPTFEPWHDKPSGKTYLRHGSGKCLHYYFYFIDEDLGLCYLRVPTWAPYRLQFYFNGHCWLAAQLRKHKIHCTLQDNVFLEIQSFARAQELANDFSVKRLHRRLDRYARRCCPVLEHFPAGYHWSLLQVEYATDIVFKNRQALAALYDTLVRTAVHAVKAENVATFLGRVLHPLYQGEVGTDFHTRIQGTRIKHHMGAVSIKMYDKFALVLRIETTANDVSFFKHHRKVEHRDGSSEFKLAPLKKSIYSLASLRELLYASNHRYLDFISGFDDPSSGNHHLDKIARPASDQQRTYRGFNLLDSEDLTLFLTLARGEFNISGFQNRDLRRLLPKPTAAQLGRTLKRLRMHGLIKKIGRTYKYYLTKLGKRAIIAALKLRAFLLIPTLAQPMPA